MTIKQLPLTFYRLICVGIFNFKILIQEIKTNFFNEDPLCLLSSTVNSQRSLYCKIKAQCIFFLTSDLVPYNVIYC